MLPQILQKTFRLFIGYRRGNCYIFFWLWANNVCCKRLCAKHKVWLCGIGFFLLWMKGGQKWVGEIVIFNKGMEINITTVQHDFKQSRKKEREKRGSRDILRLSISGLWGSHGYYILLIIILQYMKGNLFVESQPRSMYVDTKCASLNKLIIDEREGETFLCPSLALHEMDGNFSDGQRWPIPLSDSSPVSAVREGRLAHYDPLDLHKVGMSLDMKKIWANFQLLIAHHVTSSKKAQQRRQKKFSLKLFSHFVWFYLFF